MADLPHTKMKAPFLRIVETYETPAGDTMAIWDLRVVAPNRKPLPTATTHSIEHFLIYGLRSAASVPTHAAPMGCRSGFYIITLGLTAFDEMATLVEGVLLEIASATEVPAANAEQCGWAARHSLLGAQWLAAELVKARGSWPEPLDRPVEFDLDALEKADGNGER